MNVSLWLKSLYTRISGVDGNEYVNSCEEEKFFLNQFNEPVDDIERSYYQYLCQKKCTRRWKNIITNVGAIILFFPYLISYLVKARYDKKKQDVDAVMTQDFIKSGRLPKSLRSILKSTCVGGYDKGSLDKSDVLFLLNVLRRYPIAPLFIFKCMCRIASYAQIIRCHSPKSIIASAEYSFTSSVLTYYCEERKIQHINIMHGEKEFYIRDAFSRFHRFYIWDNFYKLLFKEMLRANKTEYIVEKPPFLVLQKGGCADTYVYYMQIHTNKQIQMIRNSLKALDHKFVVRPHPLHFNKKISQLFETYEIENPEKVSLERSLMSAEMVISICSTVLLQAYWLGIPVVIDDISDPIFYSELKKRNYIMLNKPHTLLSDLLRKT